MAKGSIGIVGAGPGGMAAALAAIRVGFDVTLFERAREETRGGQHPQSMAPAQKVLKLIGVDTDDLGGRAMTPFRNAPRQAGADCAAGGQARRLLRWGCTSDDRRAADGVIELGATVVDMPSQWQWRGTSRSGGRCCISSAAISSSIKSPMAKASSPHDRTTQVSYTPIRHEGKWGYEWWVLEAFKDSDPPLTDLKRFAATHATRFSPFVQDLIARTPEDHLQRWEIRDRPPLKQWSKGGHAGATPRIRPRLTRPMAPACRSKTAISWRVNWPRWTSPTRRGSAARCKPMRTGARSTPPP